MAIVPLPRVLKTILTNLDCIKMFYLGVDVTNIQIWVLFSFSYNFLYFSPIFYKLFQQCFLGLSK